MDKLAGLTAQEYAELLIDYTIKRHNGCWVQVSSNLNNKYMTKLAGVTKKLDDNIVLAYEIIDILMAHKDKIVESESMRLCLSFGYRIDEAYDILDKILMYYREFYGLRKREIYSTPEVEIAYDIKEQVNMFFLIEGYWQLAKNQQNLFKHNVNYVRKRFGKYIGNPLYKESYHLKWYFEEFKKENGVR